MQTGTILRFKKDIENSGIKKGDKAIYLGDSKIRITTGTGAGFVYSLLISAPIEELGCPDKTAFCKNCFRKIADIKCGSTPCGKGEMFEPEILDNEFIFCKSFHFFDKDKYYGD